MKNKYKTISGIIFVIIFAIEAGSVAFAQSVTSQVQRSAVKNIDSSMGTTSTTTVPSAESEVFGRGINTIKNIVPERIQNTVGSFITKLNNFRLQERDLVEIARTDNIEQIDNLNQKEIDALAWKKSDKSGTKQTTATNTPQFDWSNHAERILRYTYWMFLVLAGVILNYAWIFYSVLFLISIMVLRAIWGRIRSAGV